MSYEYRLTSKNLFILSATFVSLGILLFIFGLIWGKLLDSVNHSGARESFAAKMPGKTLSSRNTLSPNDSQSLKTAMIKLKTGDLAGKILKLYFKHPLEDNSLDFKTFTILHDGFWKTGLNSVIRLVPAQNFNKDVSFFSLICGVFITKEKAYDFISSLNESYDLFLIKAFDKKENAWYIVIIDDFDNLGEAEEAAANFVREKQIPAVIAFVEDYSQSPLRKYKIGAKKNIPPKEPVPSEKKEDVPRPYALRLSCYNTKETALRAVSIYEKKGLDTYIPDPGKKKGYCRWIVCMGHYESIEAAKKAKKELKIKDCLIIKNLGQ